MSLYVGAISGTSLDGLDIALVEDDSPPVIRAATTTKFPEPLQTELRALAQADSDEISRFGTAHVSLGQFIGSSITAFLRAAGIAADDVTAIGSHGQTIRHAPDESIPYSIQIGDGSQIAEHTGIDTVVDFRTRDLAAGGQGAPLVPIFHEALFRVPGHDRVVVNIGGIANITVLKADTEQTPTGFDSGPGNALLDAWCRQVRQQPYDDEGTWASTGTVIPALLDALLQDPYYKRKPPKSTGSEYFNLAYIESSLAPLTDAAANDVQATLCELTAQTIAAAMPSSTDGQCDIVVCGGGRHNADLMTRLGREIAYTVLACDDLGIDGDALEAAAFAYLAKCFIEKTPGNVPAVTGARQPRILGCLYPGSY